MKPDRVHIAVLLCLALLIAGCAGQSAAGPVAAPSEPLTSSAAADLATNLHEVAKDIDANGSPPHSPLSVFLRDGTGVLKGHTGPGSLFPWTPDTLMDLDRRLADVQADYDEALAKYQQEADDLRAENDRLRSSGATFRWIVLGLSALVALAGVVVVWVKLGWKIGLVALGGWSLAYTAISLGMFWKYDREAVIAGLTILLLVPVCLAGLAWVLARVLARVKKTLGAVAVGIEEAPSAAAGPVKQSVQAATDIAGVADELNAELAARGYLGKGFSE